MTFEPDPVKLLVRWQGLGTPLSDLEKELLLANLYEENRKLEGDLHMKALAEIEKYRLNVKKGRVTWQSFRAQ